jgi:hypothetical protein
LTTAEYVAVVAKKDVVSLVVKCDAVTSVVLWVWWKNGSERTAHLQTQTCIEVVEDYLWFVLCKSTYSGGTLLVVRFFLIFFSTEIRKETVKPRSY